MIVLQISPICWAFLLKSRGTDLALPKYRQVSPKLPVQAAPRLGNPRRLRLCPSVSAKTKMQAAPAGTPCGRAHGLGTSEAEPGPSSFPPWCHDLVKLLHLSEPQFSQLQSGNHVYLARLLRGLKETTRGVRHIRLTWVESWLCGFLT